MVPAAEVDPRHAAQQVIEFFPPPASRCALQRAGSPARTGWKCPLILSRAALPLRQGMPRREPEGGGSTDGNGPSECSGFMRQAELRCGRLAGGRNQGLEAHPLAAAVEYHVVRQQQDFRQAGLAARPR